MLKSRGGGMHHSLLSLGTGASLTFTCIKSECPAQARMGGEGNLLKAGLRPSGPAAQRPSGLRPTPDFPQFLSSGNSTHMQRSASGLGV